MNSRDGAPPVNRQAAEHMNSMTYVTIFLPLCAKYSLNCWHLNNAMHDRENNRSTTIRCMLGACRLFSAAAHQIDWLGVLPKIYPKLSHLYLRFASPCDGVISFFLSSPCSIGTFVCIHSRSQEPSTAQYPHVVTLASYLLLARSITIEERCSSLLSLVTPTPLR